MKQAILDYLFPESWHSLSEKLYSFFFESQSKQVLGNAILSGSLVIASIFLFPIKEKYSAVFEKEQGYPNGPYQEFPLWLQGIEETRLFLFYLTAQMIILWIGYYPYFWTEVISVSLSYFFLFYTFGLDIISPTLQRHRVKYSKINKLLFRNLICTLLFGLLFSLPAIVISQWILSIETLNLLEISIALFILNLFFIAISIPAGTAIGSHLLKENTQVINVATSTKILGYLIMTLGLISGLVFHSRLIQSMHHKSQILKAEYAIDFDSFDFNFKSLGSMLTGDSIGDLKFNLTIDNPTEYDMAFENSQIYIFKNSKQVSKVAIEGFSVPAGEEKEITMKFNAKSNFSEVTLGEISQALDGWTMEMHIELFPGIPFIIQLMDSDND
ncbi:hypothetical protein [Pleionea sediminis]|uniref:hypothetical protein n=1 Tax=Pleionea sediminis TaxID=2569479 RepID=UPI001185BD59|nr:hypothetical protein [Pleionea sediminis]